MRIAVLGGGPAGLAAAWWAARDGHDVTLLEAAPRLGGMAASVTVGGVRADLGSHRLHPAVAPAVLADLQDLPDLQLQRRVRDGRVRIADRWVRWPVSTSDLVRSLPPRLAAGLAADALLSPLRRPRDATFADVVRSRLGPTLATHLYEPSARLFFGSEPTQLAGVQATRRIATTSPWQLAARLVAPDPLRGWFWYPATGFGAIVEALAGAARREGARIVTGARVDRVQLRRPGAGAAPVEVGSGDDRVDADVVLSTLPLPVLTRVVDPSPPAAVRDAAARLRSRALVLVHLVVPDRWTPFDAHYLPEPTTPVSRLSEPTRYRDGPDPADRSVVCAEVPCEVGDRRWRADDATLVGVVRATLREVGLPDPEPLDVAVTRLPAAYPVLGLDAPAALARVGRWAEGLERVASLGRHGLHAHDNTHHALAEARAAVAALGEEPGRGPGLDRRAWRAALADFAEHVVED